MKTVKANINVFSHLFVGGGIVRNSISFCFFKDNCFIKKIISAKMVIGGKWKIFYGDGVKYNKKVLIE